MKSHRAVAFLALILLLGLVGPLSAEPARPVAPEPGFLSPVVAAPVPAARPGLCPTFYCPIYYPENDCTCEWIECPNGQIVCGRWNGTAAASSSSAAPAAPTFFAPAVQPAAGGASAPR